ncbi:BspA family leucine-rich repeat surface protein [Lactiplantibacillus plantarum]|uniref:BspA family leucine-rich repeat surface protein n=1 Tax=Lactiplantibacillus plantarum TaxID=1590 RepID=UPI0026496680|nr:BspA family leucine-rich repeat surface protein [Lactiplantibacillus plantarum]WGS67400.1 bacterial Ig-like domain-containing protein [Lactiplantibacillus plantarum]
MRLIVRSVRLFLKKWGITINYRESEVKCYKMYKSGKMWLLASASLLLLNTQLLTAHADEPTSASTSETSVVATNGVSIQNQGSSNQTLASSVSKTDNVVVANDENASITNQTVIDAQPATNDEPQSAASTAALNGTSGAPNSEVAADSMAAVNGLNTVAPATNSYEASRTDDLFSNAAESTVSEQQPEASEQLLLDTADASERKPAADLQHVEQHQLVDDLKVESQHVDTRAVTRADEDEMSGNFGVDWHFDASTGTLTLNGGTLNNSYGDNPWRRKSWAPMIKCIVIADKIVAGTNMNSLFANLDSVTRYEGLEKIDTSAVTNMQSLFKENTSLERLDLSAWQVGNVTTMVNMFMGNFMGTELKYLNLSGWDTHNVANMQNMFQFNGQLRTIDGLTDWDTRSVTTMANMFARTGVRHLNLTSFDSASLVEIDGAFEQMSDLERIEFGTQFTVAKVTQINSLFNDDAKLKVLDLSHFNMQSVEQNWQMLAGLTSLQTLTLGPGLDFSQHGTQPLVDLPEVPKNSKYTGKWVNVADSSQTFTSAELLAQYSGNHADTATFVWETVSAATITGKDSTLFLNQKWDWTQNIAQLVDQNGQLVDPGVLFSTDPQAVTVSGEPVDTSRPGSYHVILTYAGRQTNVVVTVVANQSQLNLHAQEVAVEIDPATGSAVWRPRDNFASATDADGRSVEWQNVTVLGEPDLTRPGTYEVVYQFTDLTGQLVTATTTVTVTEQEADVEDLTELVVQDTTVTVGDHWQAADNFVSASDATGRPLTLADLVVIGDVDTTQPGTYEITYQYTNANGLQWTQTATITVVEGAGNGETPLPGEPAEPELPEEPGTPEQPETPETPETPGEPSAPGTPDQPELPEVPEQSEQPGTTEHPDTSDPNSGLTGANAGSSSQREQADTIVRPEFNGGLEKQVTTVFRDNLKLNTAERNEDGIDAKRYAKADTAKPEVTMAPVSHPASVAGELPQTSEQVNRFGLLGLMMLMVTGLASIVGIKRRQG